MLNLKTQKIAVLRQVLLKTVQPERPKTASNFKSDVLGSYTGVDISNPYEEPIQDADDL